MLEKKGLKVMNWKNLIKLEILALCIGSMIGDAIVLMTKMCGFTLFGIGTFLISALIADLIITDFEQIKSTHTYRPKHAMSTERK